MYFKNIKLNDWVFSLIFGKGVVVLALDEKFRVDGFYCFKVQYENCIVSYTEEGIPDWGSGDKTQTVFYLKDVDLNEITDLNSHDENSISLTRKQISRYRDEDELEFLCPSGVWRNVLDVPSALVSKALRNVRYHMFRKEA